MQIEIFDGIDSEKPINSILILGGDINGESKF